MVVIPSVGGNALPLLRLPLLLPMPRPLASAAAATHPDARGRPPPRRRGDQ
jgi:hypothetical protein